MVWLLSQLANVEPKGLHGRNPDYPRIAASPQTTATNRSEVFLRRLLAALEPAITVFTHNIAPTVISVPRFILGDKDRAQPKVWRDVSKEEAPTTGGVGAS